MGGCASQTAAQIDGDYNRKIIKKTNANFDIYVNKVADTRLDKTSVGWLARRHIYTKDAVEWLKSGLESRGYFLIENESALSPDLCIIDVNLKLAYIRPSSSSMAANIIVEAGVAQTKQMAVYRGNHTAINWNTSDKEVGEALAKALEKSLVAMEVGITEKCKNN